jgi:hypothetical protein
MRSNAKPDKHASMPSGRQPCKPWAAAEWIDATVAGGPLTEIADEQLQGGANH